MQCMCVGFKTPDVIRLCQKFRTHSMTDVTAELKNTPCSFCTHPLSSHSTNKQGDSSETSNTLLLHMKKPPLGKYENLTLKKATSLPCSLANHNCLELITPLTMTDSFVLLMVGKSQGSSALRLAILTSPVNATEDNSRPVDVEETSCPAGGRDSESLETQETTTSNSKRVRKKHPTNPVVASNRKRSSMRLATKKQREEEKKVFRSLKGLKGIGRCSEMELIESDASDVNHLSDLEQKQVDESTIAFLQCLEATENYESFPLPQVTFWPFVIQLNAQLVLFKTIVW